MTFPNCPFNMNNLKELNICQTNKCRFKLNASPFGPVHYTVLHQHLTENIDQVLEFGTKIISTILCLRLLRRDPVEQAESTVTVFCRRARVFMVKG